MQRLLRALASIGLLTEQTDSHYSLTPLGMVLRSDHPRSVRAWARVVMSDETVRPWKEMAYSLRTGQNAFEHVFGCDPWTYRAEHPEYSALFNEAMQALTEGPNALVSSHYPFGTFDTLVDIGGGNGALLIAILSRHPNLRGIVFELPHVTSAAKARVASAGLSDRCEVVAGDARTTTPPGVDNIPQQDSASNAFNKLARTFALQLEALKRYRTGGEQRVTVVMRAKE